MDINSNWEQISPRSSWKSGLIFSFTNKLNFFSPFVFKNSVCTIFILWKQGRFTKPFQASSIWYQLKDLVFIKWKILIQKWIYFCKKYFVKMHVHENSPSEMALSHCVKMSKIVSDTRLRLVSSLLAGFVLSLFFSAYDHMALM